MNKVVNDCGDQPTEEANTGCADEDNTCPHCGSDTLEGYWHGYRDDQDYVVYCTLKTCDYSVKV